MVLDNPCQRRSKREIRKHFGINANKNTKYKNVQDKAKALVRGKFIVLGLY